MKIIRIEYELKETNWKCNIIAKDSNDAIEYLQEKIKAPLRIIATEDKGEVHGITEFCK